MSKAPVALLLLNVQRHDLENQPHEREVARNWTRQIDVAREIGQLIALVQWDGDAEGENLTFSRGWTLFPDFRAEEGDLLIRAVQPDAFASSDLHAQLQAHGVNELVILALRGSEAANVTAQSARDLGYAVNFFEEDIQ